jgi:putative ABC transport system substrate-binding protein
MRAFGLKRLGLVYPAEDPAAGPHRDSVLAAADTLGIEVVDEAFADPESAAAAVDALARKDIDALFISNSPTAIGALAVIEPAAERHGLPIIANTAVAAQAVITLQPDTIELNRQLGRQAARILGGAPVADVPVEDPRQFSIVINAGKAKQLGIRLDPEVLREADEVRR